MQNFGTTYINQVYLPVLAVADFNGDGIADVAVAQGEVVDVYLGAPPVDASISKSHTGTFQLGQTGATFTISVSNLGPNATAGAVTVNDTPPSDFTVTGASGVGWSCTLAVQCVRNDLLPAGGSYPPITVTVTVSTSAAETVTNVATVSVAGDTNLSNNTASDVAVVVHPQTILLGPILPIAIESPVLTLTGEATSGLLVSYTASGNCTVSGNVATATGVGSCTITAIQAGSAGYFPASNVVQTFTILPNASSIAIVSSGSPSTFGAPVTLTATVSPAGATGRVTFYDGPKILGAQVVSSGTAALSVRLYSTGTRQLTAHYSGDTSYAPSTSSAIPQIVQSVPAFGFNIVRPTPMSINFIDDAAVDDFNGDGLPDIVTGTANNEGFDNLAVYLNNGNGTFQPPVFSGSASPLSIATGDFNGDGKTDVAMQAAASSTISVRFGNGDGSFGPATSYPVGGSSLVAADLNGDGYPDLVVWQNSTFNVAVLINKGDGTFYAATEYTVPGYFLGYVSAIGDVNGDGKLDLVTGAASTSGYQISVLPGNGDGTFAAPVSTPVVLNGDGSPVVAALGDLNGDGKLDIVMANDVGPVSVALGNGDGTFGSITQYPINDPYNAGSAYQGAEIATPVGIAIVDVNGDGRADVAAVYSWAFTGYLQLFLGNGDGTLQSAAVYLYDSPSSLAFSDLNGDGRVDFVSATSETDSVDILEGAVGPFLNVTKSHARRHLRGSSACALCHRCR